MQNDIDVLPAFRFPFLRAVLPLPPGINHSYQIIKWKMPHGRWGHRLAATQELNQFKEFAAQGLIQSQLNWEVVKAIRETKSALTVTIRFYFPDARRRDVDGGIKAVLDATFNYLTLDDNLVTDLYARKTIDRGNPRCEICVAMGG